MCSLGKSAAYVHVQVIEILPWYTEFIHHAN